MLNAYLSPEEVAELAGVTVKTVWNWCKSGQLPACKPGGKFYRIKREDFERFMQPTNTDRDNPGK